MRLMNMSTPTDIIPEQYQGHIWKKPEDSDAPKNTQIFNSNLEKILNMFLKGEIPKFSVFIAAPPQQDKTLFAFSCLQTAVSQDFSVAPYLSTGDWQRLQKISEMNPFYKLYGKYTWDDLAGRDVVFLFVDHSDNRRDDIPLLKSILDARAAFGKPTFIISDYKLTSLVPAWNKQSYTMISSSDPNRDYLRYPVILHRMN